jgi:hypothetical protein
MATFRNTSPSTSIEDIHKIENILGMQFPKSYLNHLLQENGGRVSPNIFSFIESGRLTESDVDWFLAINGFDYNDFFQEIESLKLDEKRMPTHIVPIAYDSGGNFVCISCGNNDYGKVYFWDLEREVDYSVSDDSDYSNLYMIADSFEEFLNGLH